MQLACTYLDVLNHIHIDSECSLHTQVRTYVRRDFISFQASDCTGFSPEHVRPPKTWTFQTCSKSLRKLKLCLRSREILHQASWVLLALTLLQAHHGEHGQAKCVKRGRATLTKTFRSVRSRLRRKSCPIDSPNLIALRTPSFIFDFR